MHGSASVLTGDLCPGVAAVGALRLPASARYARREVAASLSSIRIVKAAGQTVTGVGKYRYIAMLAEGGMADVYLAVTQSAGFEKLVVIKQLRGSLAEDPSFVAMFMDEARLAARLNHPNVVQTLEVGTDPASGLHFIAMEFLEGVAHVRFARLKERVPPPLAFSVRILVDVLRGLHYAHELRDFDGKPLNVVHRDVSPQNVMLTFAGGVKVLDFGIAKAALAAEQRPEDFKGKLEYMAPEQARREDVDRRADVFSVGVMLFEALTRRRLYRKGEDKLALITHGQLPDVREIAPSSPKCLARVCARAMKANRDDRYPTADAMADELEEWLGSTTQHVSARDVGSWVADKFSATREKIGAAIEAQLTLFRAIPSSAAPDTLPLSRLPLTDLPLELSDPPPPLSIPSGMMPPAFPSSAPFTAAMAQTGNHSGLSTGRHSVIAAAGPAPRTPVPVAGRAVLVGFLGILVVSGAFAAGMLTARRGAPATAAVTAMQSGEVSTADEVEIAIRAQPPEATIALDGASTGANPATIRRPRDTIRHTVHIEAPGHEPRDEPLTFDRSMLVVIELHPLGPAIEFPSGANKGRGYRRPRHGAKGADPETP